MNLKPYLSARDEYKGKDGLFLDANENTIGARVSVNEGFALNRYPDPQQLSLKKRLSDIKGLPVENIFLGNGSDEAIDILFRAFCVPGKDNVIICPPTYGMYEVAAAVNDVEAVKVPLLVETFALDEYAVLKSVNKNTKLIFICCPNNPTGSPAAWKSIKNILEKFKGLVVVDEAYIDFASYGSLVPELPKYPNLVILQTFSKAWGLAGLRVGMAFGSGSLISVFNKIKSPYNVGVLSQELVLKALDNVDEVIGNIKSIVSERERLSIELSRFSFVRKVYKSEANFILVKVRDAEKLYNYLINNKIVVRDRSNVLLCEECLRITVGTMSENLELISILKKYSNE